MFAKYVAMVHRRALYLSTDGYNFPTDIFAVYAISTTTVMTQCITAPIAMCAEEGPDLA